MCGMQDISPLICDVVVALIVCMGVGDDSSLLCDEVVALYCICVWVGMLVHCFVMKLLLSLYVCVGGDVRYCFVM